MLEEYLPLAWGVLGGLIALGTVLVWVADHRQKRLGDPTRRRALRRHERARRAIAAWPTTRDHAELRWGDYLGVPKDGIVGAAAGLGWFYRGQDMYAEGWPLYFTRDGRVRDVFVEEAAALRTFQEGPG